MFPLPQDFNFKHQVCTCLVFGTIKSPILRIYSITIIPYGLDQSLYQLLKETHPYEFLIR